MDPYVIPDGYGGHVIGPDSIEPANYELFYTMVRHQATVRVEDNLWRSIHVDGAVDMPRIRLEALHHIETERLVLLEQARRVRSDEIYVPLQMEMIHAHLAHMFAAPAAVPPPPPPPPVEAPPVAAPVPPIIMIDDDDKDVAVVPVMAAGIEMGLALEDLEGDIEPALEVQIIEQLVELPALDDAPPPVSDDDYYFWITSRPCHRISAWRCWPVMTIRYV